MTMKAAQLVKVVLPKGTGWIDPNDVMTIEQHDNEKITIFFKNEQFLVCSAIDEAMDSFGLKTPAQNADTIAHRVNEARRQSW